MRGSRGKPARAQAYRCGSRSGFSKFGTLTSVVLPTPRTVQVVLLIIPCWVVPSAPGLKQEPRHLNHLSLVLRIVALRVSHLAHIRGLGLLLAFARQGSAFRRPAGSQLHLAHLTVNGFPVSLMGSSLPPDEANSSSFLHSVGSVPHTMYELSPVVSSRHEARAFRRPNNIRLSLSPALRCLPLQCCWVAFTGVSGSHHNHTLNTEFRVGPTLLTLS